MVNSESTLPRITFVLHDIEGGVGSMNHQIIENADFKAHFQVRILLWRQIENAGKGFKSSFSNAQEVTRFEYSRWDNFYLVLKKFNGVLNEWPGSIVANDGFELEAISRFGTKSVVFSIIHDYYNLSLAIKNINLIDYFVCHTTIFSRALLSNHELRQRAQFLLHGVPVRQRNDRQVNEVRKLRIVSISRLTEHKGVLLLFDIDRLLRERGVEAEWTIIGSGELESKLREQWKGQSAIRFCQPDTSHEVYELAAEGDIFISPSNFEGYGIALLEAMACGLVPVIHRLPVGVYSELPAYSGFSIEPGDVNGFAECISRLNENRALLATMRNKAHQLVLEKYDISKTASLYMEYFESHLTSQVNKGVPSRSISNTGVLDKSYLPNALVRLIKKIRGK